MHSPPSSGDIRRPRFPHVYVIIFSLILMTGALGLVIPSGSYERDAQGRALEGSFAYDAEARPGPVERAAESRGPGPPRGLGLAFAVLKAPLKGIESASEVIAFLLILGGAFKVIEETRAFETALRSSIRVLGPSEYLLIPVSMLLFSIGGATLGMSEEILPFILLFVPIVRLLGYHPVVGVAVPLIGSQVGFAGAVLNPFSLGIAQGIAGLPLASGWAFRTVLWLAATVAAIVFVTLQARRWGYDTETLDPDLVISPHGKARLTRAQVLVLLTLCCGLALIIWGLHRYRWHVTEMGAVFLTIGILAGIFGGFSANRIARRFVTGARDLVSAALVVGVARGIVVLAEETHILDTVLHSSAVLLSQLPGLLSLNLMFFLQTVLNFFLPSGSGQAALTMPTLAPLAELLGLTRQMAVLAFQLGDGFSNMIVPTSAVLMGSLEAAKVSYGRWFAFAWRLQLWLFVFGVVALSIAYGIGFGP